MKKRLISILLAVAVSAMTLVGCGSEENSTTEPGEVTSNNEAVTDEEPYTVKLVLHGTAQPDEERIEGKVNEILMPALNAKLDLEVLPWGSAAQQKQLMLSGSEKIDAFYSTVTDSIQYMNAGQIMNMSELIDKYGTNIKEIYGEDAYANSVNGFVFGVSNQIERGSIPAIFMRKDLVEKYNIDTSAIKSLEDMEAVFEVIKQGEPEMTMLYSSAKDDCPIDRLMKGFDNLGDANNCGVIMNQTESTEVVNVFASDWYMETTKLIHDWYNKGYINKDAATDTENWRTVFKAGNLFSIIFSYHPATPAEFYAATGYEFEIVPFRDYAVKDSNTYGNVIFSIAQNCENPDKTMQVLDYIYGSEEIMNLLNWGEEGIDWDYVDKENDIISFPEGVTVDTVGYSLNLGWELPNQFITHLWEGATPGTWQQMDEFNKSAKNSTALGFVFDNTGLENQIAAVTNVVAQYKGSLNKGSVDPEEYVPQFLQALEDAGINDIIQAKQEQLDKFLENK